MKASKKDMEFLHGALSKAFAEYLDSPPEEGATPAMLNTIRQFLKDNGVGIELKGDEDAIQRLREKVPFGHSESLEDAAKDILQ